jgi:hypothetical protein
MNKKLLIGFAVFDVLIVIVVLWFAYMHFASNSPQGESTILLEAESAPYTLSGRTVTMSQTGISFSLPEGWTTSEITRSSDWVWDEVRFHLPTGEAVGSVSCPPFPGGGPYESGPTAPVLKRTFIKDGVSYKAEFHEIGSNRFEIVETEDGPSSRYLGPPEVTDFVRSIISTENSSDEEKQLVCVLNGGGDSLTPEVVENFKSIYFSWR